MNKKPLKFAIIGVGGYIAPRHLKAIKDTGNILVAALDKNDSVGIIDSYFPEADFFTEFERFDRHIDKLRRKGEGVEFISICSPNYLHDAHIRFALRSGANAICEKPLVLNPWNVEGLKEIEKENLLNSIIKGVKTINNTISNILLFTKDVRLNKRYVYIADIVDDVILFLKHLMNEKKILFHNRIGENDRIYCDVELIKQVIMNIIHNAIDAVPQGGKIVIYSEETEKDSSIFVEDNGSGIDPEFIDKIFLPFHSKKAKGTGLGLSIVYKIVKAHNGNIYPMSKPGQTVFKITLPKGD